MTISRLLHSLRPLRVSIAAAVAVVALVPAGSLHAERLPSTVRPSHYSLALAPDLKAATFSGIESIDVTLVEASKAITLNSAEIAFQSVTVTAAGSRQTAAVSSDKEKEQTTFTFPAAVPAGKATLEIHYTGILNNELRGFYLSKTDRRNYAVTQFESTDARRAFPSFDEPAFKATYDVSLTIDAADTAISNTPIATDTPGPDAGKHTLKFLTSPKMSTYLVAFLVGDFQCTSGEQDGVTIRSCSTPDKIALTPYALDVAKYVLHYYNNYFGIPYPLKKLDLIALPDFEAGAMENFGAITFRETALLVDTKTASIDAQKGVAAVIAHEMAHQWFGDLVTMQWWDNIWLNEGFATWMEDKPVAAMHPEWDIDQDVASGLDGTLGLDAQPTTRAIRARADTRAEIEQMFDGISYGKASDVLLTVENYLGPETFRKGVHNYLAAHEFSNATAEDFWDAQTATSHKPVDKIMDGLISQPGVPVLTFKVPVGDKVAVSQRRFYLSPSIKPDPAQKWTLPVCFKSGQNSQQCELLSPTTTSLSVPAGKLFFPDAGGVGYYRFALPPAAYSAALAQVETSLTPAERISFIGNQWSELRSNNSKVGDYLDLVAAASSDPNAAVIDDAIGGVNAIVDRVAATPEEKAAIDAWIGATFSPQYQKLGEPAPGDSPNKRQLRARLFSLLGYTAKDPAVLAQAHAIAAKYIADQTSVEPALGQTALAIAVRDGDAALYDQLQKIYETSTNPEFQIGALHLLAQFEDPALARRSLDFAVSGKVRNQDAAFQIAIALNDDKTRDLTWDFIQNNWDKIQALLTPEIGQVLVSSAGSFCSAPDRDKVNAFFTEHKVPDADQALRHTIERINGCIEFRSLQNPALKTWLAARPTH